MSELAKEILPIAVMYGFVLLLAPFIGVTMWVAFDGDRPREPLADDSTTTVEPIEVVIPDRVQVPDPAGEQVGAA